MPWKSLGAENPEEIRAAREKERYSTQVAENHGCAQSDERLASFCCQGHKRHAGTSVLFNFYDVLLLIDLDRGFEISRIVPPD